MTQPLFIDSWGWISLANRKEESHQSVRALFDERAKGSKIVTTDFVLDEVITFLFLKTPATEASSFVSSLIKGTESRLIHLERISADRFEKTYAMRLKYLDHPRISFTDFTSFVVMRELGIKEVITHDRHFEQIGLGFSLVP